MKRLLFSLLTIYLIMGGSINLFSQENKVLKNLDVGNYSKDWTLYKSLDYVNIYYLYTDCSDPKNGFYPEYILFKLENKTDSDVSVQWEYNSEYDNEASKSIEGEDFVKFDLSPQQTLEGTCDNSSKVSKLKIFVRMKNRDKIITNFKFDNLLEFKNNLKK